MSRADIPESDRRDFLISIDEFQHFATQSFASLLAIVGINHLTKGEGKAVYRLNQDWVEVEAGDYMWLRAFCPQACYAGGPGRFRYLLYKDVNRHASLELGK